MPPPPENCSAPAPAYIELPATGQPSSSAASCARVSFSLVYPPLFVIVQLPPPLARTPVLTKQPLDPYIRTSSPHDTSSNTRRPALCFPSFCPPRDHTATPLTSSFQPFFLFSCSRHRRSYGSSKLPHM